MMSINKFLGFNPHETKAAESFEGRQESIPNGKYRAVASEAVRKSTKHGDGWFWEITFTIVEGEYEGRTVVHRFNMENKSEQAIAIGRSQMKRFLECIGNLEPQNEESLCNIALQIEVKCKKRNYTRDNGEQTEIIDNEITKINPDFVEPAPAKTTNEETNSKIPPWKRK